MAVEVPIELIDAARDFIRDKRCTLWGESFTVVGGGSNLDGAALWLAAQVAEMNERVASEHVMARQATSEYDEGVRHGELAYALHLQERLDRAAIELDGLVVAARDENTRRRLRGKWEGVKLAISYLSETVRGA